ncbi:hypothetical protein MTR67_005194 [Solanum verrucosum]|uniref:Uncharacterized protein n=1 Tax=Solanum verrucosum TaxID=315347 RepID=A0AAF0Q1M2_SOLVR|nr:hypothetical protein MTR67_005194 [Solanum verrucosum]
MCTEKVILWLII